MKWILSGIAPGCCKFVLPDGRKTTLKGKTKDPPPHQRLKFRVLEVRLVLVESCHQLKEHDS